MWRKTIKQAFSMFLYSDETWIFGRALRYYLYHKRIYLITILRLKFPKSYEYVWNVAV